MMNYKYSGQDWRYVQHNVRRGHNTHCAYFNPATELSVSTFLWEKKPKKLAHLLIWCCSFRQTCPWMRSMEPRLKRSHCRFLVGALTALIRCVSCCMTSRASGVVCLFMFESEGERCSLESTCATQRVTLHHDRASLWIKDRTQIEALASGHH